MPCDGAQLLHGAGVARRRISLIDDDRHARSVAKGAGLVVAPVPGEAGATN
jgi:hypothetical protein